MIVCMATVLRTPCLLQRIAFLSDFYQPVASFFAMPELTVAGSELSAYFF